MRRLAGGEEGDEEGGRMSLFRALIITRQIAECMCVCVCGGEKTKMSGHVNQPCNNLKSICLPSRNFF